MAAAAAGTHDEKLATEYDKPCIQHPGRRAQMADPADPATTVLKMIFARYDADGKLARCGEELPVRSKPSAPR